MHVLKPLKYASNALEPQMDTATVEIHHGRHLQAYVDNLNKALDGYPEWQGRGVRELVVNLDKLPSDIRNTVRNNAGGIYNHDLFFDILTKGGKELPKGELKSAIEKKWGTLDALGAEIKKGGLSQFGSGWTWLVADKEGNLYVMTTANQDVPDLNKYTPVIGIDVWEHSYYLKYQNRRAEYLDRVMEIIDWEVAEKYYANLSP